MTDTSHSSPRPVVLACRRCGQMTTWQNNPFRPFCSERCKLIDLGAWAKEDYRLPTNDCLPPTTAHEDE